MDGRIASYPEENLTDRTDVGYSAARLYPAIGAIVHTTSGTDSYGILSGTRQDNAGIRSAHCLIGRQGQRRIIVPYNKCAFHSGKTWWNSPQSARMDSANEVFLGIELECLDTQAPTWQQMDSAAEYMMQAARVFNWRWPFVVYGHYALAVPLGRRSDPVRFDWGAFQGYLYARSKLANIGGL